jgi:hypothetical protein
VLNAAPSAQRASRPSPRLRREGGVADDVDHGHAGDLGALLHAPEGGGLEHAEPDDEADGHQDDADEERDPPAPGQEVLVVHARPEQGEGTGAQGQAEPQADLGARAPQPALPRRCVLDGHEDRPGPLAAEGDPAEHAQQDQQQRRPDADGGVGGQHPDQGGRGAGERHRRDQGRAPSHPVTEVTEDQPSDRPGDEADREGREGEQRADGLVPRGEEELREHEARRGREEEEVVPLDRRADEGRDQDGTCLVGWSGLLLVGRGRVGAQGVLAGASPDGADGVGERSVGLAGWPGATITPRRGPGRAGRGGGAGSGPTALRADTTVIDVPTACEGHRRLDGTRAADDHTHPGHGTPSCPTGRGRESRVRSDPQGWSRSSLPAAGAIPDMGRDRTSARPLCGSVAAQRSAKRTVPLTRSGGYGPVKWATVAVTPQKLIGWSGVLFMTRLTPLASPAWASTPGQY